MTHLLGVQREILRKKLKKLIGRNLEVLAERGIEGTLYGRTKFDAPEIDCSVRVEGDAKTGDFCNVKITGASTYQLRGKIIPN